jgi:hypothetical protein
MDINNSGKTTIARISSNVPHSHRMKVQRYIHVSSGCSHPSRLPANDEPNNWNQSLLLIQSPPAQSTASLAYLSLLYPNSQTTPNTLTSTLFPTQSLSHIRHAHQKLTITTTLDPCHPRPAFTAHRSRRPPSLLCFPRRQTICAPSLSYNRAAAALHTRCCFHGSALP